MEDDIDIEEHDVLDHPRIRNIFPDLSRIKVEVPDEEYEDSELQYEHYDYSEHEEQTSTYSNRIILGSKPAIEIKVEKEDNNGEVKKEEKTNHEEEATTSNYGQSVLILGSKPAYISDLNSGAYSIQEETHHEDAPDEQKDTDDDNDSDEEEYEIKDVEVSLVDWGPKLKANPCYCDKCKILFPTTNTLQAHNMVAHSFLVALEVNKAFKSTARPNVAKKLTNTGKFCNHCNKMFPDSDTLINHLYQSLIIDKNKGLFKNKPDVKPEVVEEDSLPTPVKVLKTDLSTIPVAKQGGSNEMYLTCHICSCLFMKQNFYESHMRVCHRILGDLKYEMKPFNLNCKFCTSFITLRPNYNTHIKRFHNNLFLKKISDHETNLNIKYRCVKCSAVLCSYRAAREHRAAKHPTLSGITLFKKIVMRVNNGNKTVKVMKQKALKPKIPEKNTLIPKSVLYKCGQCSLHFTTFISATSHSKTCLKTIHREWRWRCNDCKCYFESSDRLTHVAQHKLSDNFVTHQWDNNLYGRILNKCPHCKCCLHEKEFWVHWQEKCKGRPVKCACCNYDIHISSIEEHIKWHQKFQFTKKDMIVVEFADNTTEERAYKKTYAYCKFCQTYLQLINKSYIPMHITGACRKTMKPRNWICMYCGLNVSHARHKNIHIADPTLTLLDMKIVTLTDEKQICPPMPKFRKCIKCNRLHCLKVKKKDHRCTDPVKTCSICNLVFSEFAYRLHMPFHEYAKRFNGERIAKSETPNPSTSGSSTIDLQDIMANYKKLAKTWNILYRCQTCDVVCDDYDKAVEHSQKHLNHMESYDTIIKHCKTCDLKFDSACFERHKELHTLKAVVKNDSFKILTYYYNTLLTASWLRLFKPLPRPQAKFILSRSIYSNFRGLKMRVIKESPSEVAIYKCGKCEMLVHPLSLSSHVDQSCEENKNGYNCSFCDVVCSTPIMKTYHENQHAFAENFKVVLFNENGDEPFNFTLKSYNNEEVQDGGDEVEDILTKNPEKLSKPEKKEMHYYVCLKCNSSINMLSKAKIHVCCKPGGNTLCTKCNLYIYSGRFFKHVQIHKKYQFDKNNITITKFIPQTAKTEFKLGADVVTATLYRCICGLHFNSLPSDKHYSECSSGVQISQENCSKCKRLFCTSELVTHLCKHHSNGKNPKFEIIPVGPQSQARPVIYKCGSCLIYFHDKISCRLHNCSSKGEQCIKCGLVFNDVSAHKMNIKGCSKMTKDNYKVIVLKNDTPHKRLFTCTTCDIYYLSSQGLRVHLKDNHCISRKVTCRKCDRAFVYASLRRHDLAHHNNGNKAKDMMVYGGKFSTGKFLLFPIKKAKTKDVPRGKYAVKCYSNKKLTASNTDRVPQLVRQRINLRYYTKNLFKCGVCEVHFPQRTSLARHMKDKSHEDEQVNCKKCGLKFTTACIERHLTVHHGRMNLKRKDFDVQFVKYADELPVVNIIKKKKNVVKVEKTEIDIESEVRTVAQNTVLYKCVPCNVHFNVERSFVFHFTQVHLTEKYCNIARIQCPECNLYFSSSSIHSHKTEHHREKFNLSRSDMHIIKYARYGDYFGTNHVYQCAKCNVNFMKLTRLLDHGECDACKVRSEVCHKCGLVFKRSQLDVHVKVHHEGMELSKKDLIIVQLRENKFFKLIQDKRRAEIFNDESDDVNVNVKSNGNDEINTSDDDKQIEIDVNEDDEINTTNDEERVKPKSAKDYELYKCRKCDINFIHQKTRSVHENDPNHDTPGTVLVCPHCNLAFTKYGFTKHLKLHHANLVTEIVENNHLLAEPKNDEINADPNSIEESEKIANDQNDKQKSNDDSINDSMCSISTASTKDRTYLYKCSVCPLNFLATRTLQMHYDVFKHYPKGTTQNCDECGLLFTQRTLGRHKTFQHGTLGQLKEIEFAEDVYLNKQQEPSDKFGRKLYICLHCKTNFNTYCNLLQHLTKCSSNESEKTKERVHCEICNLKFLDKPSLNLHKDKQHVKFKYTLENIQILDLNCDEVDKDTILLDKETDEDYIDEDSVIIDTIETKTENDNSLKRKAEAIEQDNIAEEINTEHINKNLYTKQIFKCCKCNLCFISKANFEWHIKRDNHEAGGSSCSYCDLRFPAMSLIVHGFIHHQKLNLNKEDFEIITSDSYSLNQDNVPSCSQIKKQKTKECEPFEVIIIDDNDKDENSDINLVDDVNIGNTDVDMLNVNDRETKNDSYVEVADSSENSDQSINDTGKDDEIKGYEMKLFKCAPCNVCFITQFSINKHLRKHTPMDPKDYIECKLCGYQFMIINTLHAHMTKHLKNQFNPNDILIEEYNPNKLCNGVPKKEVYFGRDKVQSNLISTTCESNGSDKKIILDTD